MEGNHTSYIDENGKVWTNIGEGVAITNFDGSPIQDVDSEFLNLIIDRVNPSEDTDQK
ncbi:MAG: hypothetical protein H7Y13_03860 [Sphingobacteriaceae bacterium]|nr:hypothetical protein [Sphingobacteriaceae bacterium]